MRALVLVALLLATASSAQTLGGSCPVNTGPAKSVTLVPGTALPQCDASQSGTVYNYSDASGDRMCVCTRAADGAYRYQNMSSGEVGTASACPASPAPEDSKPTATKTGTVLSPVTISLGVGSVTTATATVLGAKTTDDCRVTCPPAVAAAKLFATCAVTSTNTAAVSFTSLSALTISLTPTACVVTTSR